MRRNPVRKAPPPFRFNAKLIAPKRLQPALRALPPPGAELSADCVLQTRVYRRGKFPKVPRRRDALPNRLRQPRLRTRPFGGVLGGSVSPVRKDAWRSGIESQLLPCGNLLEKFLVAFPWTV